MLEDYFKSILELSREELDRGNPKERIYRSRVASIPKSKRAVVCQMIDSFLGKLYLETQSGIHKHEKDDLVCLNINFFSLLKGENVESTPEKHSVTEI